MYGAEGPAGARREPDSSREYSLCCFVSWEAVGCCVGGQRALRTPCLPDLLRTADRSIVTSQKTASFFSWVSLRVAEPQICGFGRHPEVPRFKSRTSLSE